MPRIPKLHTTKLPTQLDKGDKILMKSDTGEREYAIVTEQPLKPKNSGDSWIIFTTKHPKGCSAIPSLRIPVLRENS